MALNIYDPANLGHILKARHLPAWKAGIEELASTQSGEQVKAMAGAVLEALAQTLDRAPQRKEVEFFFEAFLWCVKFGAPLNHAYAPGYRVPLDMFCNVSGTVDMVKVLLEQGADANGVVAVGWADTPAPIVPLCQAAYNGKKSTCGVLIDHGADVNAVDISRSPAIFHALQSGHLDLAKFLFDRGARLDKQDMLGTAFHAVEQYILREDGAEEDEFSPELAQDMLSWLIEKGVDPDIKKRGGISIATKWKGTIWGETLDQLRAEYQARTLDATTTSSPISSKAPRL